MSRFGLGSVLGASAAGAYGMQQFNQSGMSGVWSMLPGGWAPSGGSSVGGSSEVSALQNELRRLTGMVGDIARNNNRPTVVTVGGRGGWSVLVVPVIVGGSVLYVYCRFTGTSMWDLFYVSKSSLTAFRTEMGGRLDKLWEDIKKQKDEFIKRVAELGRKQDDMKDSQEQLMAKQDQMDDRLRRVDDTCYQLDGKANTTIHRVEQLDNRLQDVHTGVQAANQGIHMLCSAVSEVTQKIGLHNSRTAQALHRYVSNGPAWAVAGAAALTGAPSADFASGGSLPQLLAPAVSGSGASMTGTGAGTGGVAAPGGLRGLMSGGGGAAGGVSKGPEAASKVVETTTLGNGFKIEEVVEVPVVAAAPVAMPMAAPVGKGLSMFGF